ncbi:MAG: formylglycine-generating enzyme family protein [Luteimonas sp.]
MRGYVALLLLLLPVAGVLASGIRVDSKLMDSSNMGYATLPGGNFRSALKYEDRKNGVRVAPFQLMQRPVTNAQFLAFVQAHPQWRRDRVATVFAEPRYVSLWAGPTQLGASQPAQPVTQVSWFAAAAYCGAQGARLPTWIEWEYAAAADETRRDARKDPVWLERILGWYSRPSNQPLPRAGLQAPNVYGVQDLHGLIWEWTDDFSALLVSSDNRGQDDSDKTKFCGAGALSMNDRENYAVLMRVAMLSSLEARDTTTNLGFRCARDIK